MKYTALLLLTFLLGCNSSSDNKDTDVVSSKKDNNEVIDNSSDEINKTAPYEESIMLLGKADRRGMERKDFNEWFGPGYRDYTPNAEVIAQLKPLMKDVNITMFMGTWCEDSHRDVPHFYKILDAVNYDESKLEVYAVSEEKTTPEKYEEGKNIIQVPTFIFYKDGKELGRIVEYSIRTVEQDMLDILSGKKYKNPYSE